MPLLLHINTSGSEATIALGNEHSIIAQLENKDQNSHASFLHKAIENVLQHANEKLENIDVVTVSNGPGSYTGLRVGLSAAKGICYALQKPLILINTLQIMAAAMREVSDTDLYIPAIDARRMEIFTAVYDKNLQAILEPTSLIVDENSFEDYKKKSLTFAGSGSNKLKKIIYGCNCSFIDLHNIISAHNILANPMFTAKEFADVAYSEPYYSKAFYDTRKNK